VLQHRYRSAPCLQRIAVERYCVQSAVPNKGEITRFSVYVKEPAERAAVYEGFSLSVAQSDNVDVRRTEVCQR